MKYKVGDRVKIKSLDWYNRYTNGTEVDCGAYPFISDMKEFCGQERIIANVGQECYFLLGVDDIYAFTDEMIEGLVEEETVLNKWTGLKVELELSKSVIGVSNVESLHGERFMSGFVKAIIPPEGYTFKDENGNIINAKMIVLEKKKKEYPKTYEECEKVLRYDSHRLDNMGVTVRGYKWELIRAFQILLICRDAYWKIAGEEMGLGKPWGPSDSDYITGRYCIFVHRENIICDTPAQDCILTFPTAEMRDAFKENFGPDIEICKELL